MPKEHANDNEIAITEVKYDRNVTNDALKNIGTKDMVVYKRDDRMMTKVKRPIQTRDIDTEFMTICANQWKIDKLMIFMKPGDK